MLCCAQCVTKAQLHDSCWLTSRCQEKLVLGGCVCFKFPGTGRGDHKRGGGLGSQVVVIIVILLGLEWGNQRFWLSRRTGGGGNLMESLSWSPTHWLLLRTEIFLDLISQMGIALPTLVRGNFHMAISTVSPLAIAWDQCIALSTWLSLHETPDLGNTQQRESWKFYLQCPVTFRSLQQRQQAADLSLYKAAWLRYHRVWAIQLLQHANGCRACSRQHPLFCSKDNRRESKGFQ